jgi:broad specificity phosphatase PhoE
MTNTVLLARHGSTGFRSLEGWRQIPLNATGRAQAVVTGNWLADNADKLPVQISRIISSDLIRSTETANKIATAIGLDRIDTDKTLRAFDPGQESRAAYKARMQRILPALLADPGLLVVGHRSQTAFLAQRLGLAPTSDPYSRSLLDTGGVLAFNNTDIEPLYRPLSQNWPGRSGTLREAYDSVDDKDDRCIKITTDIATEILRNNTASAPTAGSLEHRARKDLTAPRKDLTYRHWA